MFSGYDGLDLAVERVLNAEMCWSSEINEPVARVFSHRWPHAPNLGDIATLNWHEVPPVDVLCFPHLPVAPPQKEGGAQRNPATPTSRRPATVREMEPDPWHLGDNTTRPLRAIGAVLGDLCDLRFDAEWIGLPASLVGAPHQRRRIFILAHRPGAVPHATALGRFPWRTKLGTGTSTPRGDRPVPSHQIIDLALHGPDGSPSKRDEPETLWSLIEGLFGAGDATPTPSLDGNTSPDGTSQLRRF